MLYDNTDLFHNTISILDTNKDMFIITLYEVVRKKAHLLFRKYIFHDNI